jgi:polar amino acid transport system substrate-binding protein
LFNAFSQADASITQKYGGKDLGLTISKRLTEMMGGKIWVESVLGQGSSFFFNVKLKVIEGAHDLETGAPVSFKGLTALVVDDDNVALEIISEVLRRVAFEVITLTGGQEAIAYLEERDWAPDLLVIDWRTPDLDSLDTIKILQRKCSPPTVPKNPPAR